MYTCTVIEQYCVQLLKRTFGSDDEMIVDRIKDLYVRLRLFHHMRISSHNEFRMRPWWAFHSYLLYKNYDFVALEFVAFVEVNYLPSKIKLCINRTQLRNF